jgi:hypothetical protein
MKEIIKVKNKLDKDFRTKELDFGKLNDEMARVKNMMDKNKCSDVFYDLEKTIAKKDVTKYLRYKYMVNNAVKQFQKLQVLMSMGCIKGEMYILVMIEIIRLSKIIFVQQIEQGLAVFIPKKISQDDLSLSFRYYDPVLRII